MVAKEFQKEREKQGKEGQGCKRRAPNLLALDLDIFETPVTHYDPPTGFTLGEIPFTFGKLTFTPRIFSGYSLPFLCKAKNNLARQN